MNSFNKNQSGPLVCSILFFLLIIGLIGNGCSQAFGEETTNTPAPTGKEEPPWYGTRSHSLLFGTQIGYHLFEPGQSVGGLALQDRATLGLRLGYAFLPFLDGELSFTYVPTDNTSVEVDLYTYFISAVGNLLPNRRFTPYVSFGVGGYSMGTPATNDANHEFACAYAGGLKWFFLENVAFRAEGRGISVLSDPHTNLEITAGLVVYADLMKRRDRDRDGVPDRMDRCPKVPEDKDGFEDDDGCPEADNDKDGLPDKIDKCPNKPEDTDGFEDEDGCPEVDNDSDGIADVDDKCPNSPEDLDGFEDQDGCPETDNDKDGILDEDDQCPNEPETLNGVLDEDGCPDKALKKFSGVVRGIKFALNSSIIDLTSYPLLDEAAQTLLDNPEVKIIIEGHTDSTGTKQYNLGLSRRRAEAVRQYLIAKGISPFRIRAVGYGEERPIADNRTQTGRAMNRRIQFTLTSPGPSKAPKPRKP